MFTYIINILAMIIFLAVLVIISIKINATYNLNQKKYMQVLDITRLGKNNSIAIVKIGEEGVLLGVSPSNINKIKDISKEDIEQIEKEKNNNRELLKKQFSFEKIKIKK